jgi:hypothetical protein
MRTVAASAGGDVAGLSRHASRAAPLSAAPRPHGRTLQCQKHE